MMSLRYGPTSLPAPSPSSSPTWRLDQAPGEIGDEGYARVLAEHHRLCRRAWQAHSGVEVDTEGDAFFVVFEQASDALAAAAAAQEELASGPVRVRMGLHTGTVLLTETGYVGRELHLAARIASCGHGGQVVLSPETRRLAGRTSPTSHSASTASRTSPSRSPSSSSGRAPSRR